MFLRRLLNVILLSFLVLFLILCSSNDLTEDKKLLQFAEKAWEDFYIESYMILPETKEVYFMINEDIDREAFEAELNKRLANSELSHYSLIIDMKL